jgi:hypothetical protein
MVCQRLEHFTREVADAGKGIVVEGGVPRKIIRVTIQGGYWYLPLILYSGGILGVCREIS